MLIPRGPLALCLDGAHLQQLGPFVIVTWNRNCVVVPACAGASIMVKNQAGVICRCPGGWAISLQAAKVRVPTKGSVTVTSPNGSSAVVHSGSAITDHGRWRVRATSGVLPTMAPLLSNLLSVLQAAPDGDPQERAQYAKQCFPTAANAVASTLLTSLAPATTTPAAAALLCAQTFSPTQLPKTYACIGGFARRDDGTCYALQRIPRSKTGPIALATCRALPYSLVYREQDNTVRARLDTTALQLPPLSVADAAAQCIADTKQAVRLSPLPISPVAVAYTPMEVLFGVPPHHVASAMTLFTRKDEKEPYKFSLIAGTRRRDSALAKALLQLDSDVTKQAANSIMLGLARGHSRATALVDGRSHGFVPGVLFRAPVCKKLLGKKSIWTTHALRRRAPPPKRLEEPFALLGKGTTASHNDADLRAWQSGAVPTLVPFRLVWQPKVDGWRVLLHNSDKGVTWASNTGRDITSLVPAAARRALKAAVANMRPFILECELVAGRVIDVSPALFAAMGAPAVPRRTRASAVTSLALTHTLFITDALVVNGNDISNQSQRDRRTACWKLRDKMGPTAACVVRLIPQFAINTRSVGEIPVNFIGRAFKAMLQADMEGVVVKAESLVYGSTHTVIKPIHYGTLSSFPRPLTPLQFSKQFPWLLAVVYMGYIDVPQPPWATPVFGVSCPGAFPPRHPWHGYTPVHIEGYKVAHSMLGAAHARKQFHVLNGDGGMHTGWTLKDTQTSTGCVQHLHPVTDASPLIWLAAERVYRRADMSGWHLPLRLYLPRVWHAQRPVRPATAAETTVMLASAEHVGTGANRED